LHPGVERKIAAVFLQKDLLPSKAVNASHILWKALLLRGARELVMK
jgi:hypothetical protein